MNFSSLALMKGHTICDVEPFAEGAVVLTLSSGHFEFFAIFLPGVYRIDKCTPMLIPAVAAISKRCPEAIKYADKIAPVNKVVVLEQARDELKGKIFRLERELDDVLDDLGKILSGGSNGGTETDSL